MIPQQLFDPASSTYTYVIHCPVTREAAIIDPVDAQLERDLALLQAQGLRLRWALETHAHADHITSAARLAEHTGAQLAAPAGCGIGTATRQLLDGEMLTVGQESLRALLTPGHTAGSMSYLWRNHVFTGDALLIDGCGRTDFQNGDSRVLFDSVTHKLFALPGETLVYPAHDYSGRHVSSIAQEKTRNPRLGGGKTLEEFTAIMASLNLPYPKFIDHAVPGNKACGECPTNLPQELQKYCGQMAESPQG